MRVLPTSPRITRDQKVWCCLIAVALASACKTKEESQQSGPAVANSSATTAPPARPPAPPAIATQAELQALLLLWQEAQNKGAFEEYQALYAKKFTGIKRSAQRERRFDRDDWLVDRKAMFAKPFTVTIGQSKVDAMPGVAIIHFEQGWKSDTYQDTGPKQLLVVREEGRLLISREEMLTSKTGTTSDATTPGFEQAALARRTRRGFALLVPGKVDLNWATEHPVYLDDDHNDRAVALPALPTATRALLDREYEIFDASGQRCLAKPERFQILTYIIPHFGIVNLWNDFGAESEGRKPQPMPDADRAAWLWGLARESEDLVHGRTLGLEFAAPAACPLPAWGRPVQPGAPNPHVVRKPRTDELAEITAAVSQHPAVLAFSRELQAEQGGSWGDALPGSARIIDAENGTELVFIQANGPGGCGYSTPPSAGLIWRRQKGKLTPWGEPIYLEGFLRGAVDVNGDGELELIGDEQIFAHAKDGYTVVVDHTPLFLDCPC